MTSAARGGFTPSDEVLLSASGVITCTADDRGFGDYGRRIPFIWSEATGLRPIVGLGGNYIHVEFINSQGTFAAFSTFPDDTVSHECIGSLGTGLVDIQPAGIDRAYISGMNERGQVSGSYVDPSKNQAYRGFTWDRSTGFQDVGNLGDFGVRFTSANGVSDSGLVAGVTINAFGEQACFVWDSSHGMQDISTGLATISSGPVISRTGVVIAGGRSTTSGILGYFVWDATQGARFIEVPSGTLVVSPQIDAVNSPGTIATGRDMFGGEMAIDTSGNTITFLGSYNALRPPGDGGHVLSQDQNGGFIWDVVNGKRYLGTQDVYCNPTSVNSRGQVVGGAFLPDTGQYQAFLWDSVNGLQTLGTLGSTGQSEATQITDTMIAGTSTVADGSTHVFYAKLDGGKPDLQVTGFTITPDPKKTPASSKGKGKGSEKESDDDSKNAKTATIKVFVANTGSGSAAASSTKIVDGKKLLTTLATPAIPAGQSVTLTYTWDLKKVEEGKHTLTATADSAAQVTETNETNNTFKTTFTIKED